jgi:hypothetical protein
MKAVGVKQLKARLSECVRLVEADDTILVTDRGEVVARYGSRSATAIGLDVKATGTTRPGGLSSVTDRYRHP